MFYDSSTYYGPNIVRKNGDSGGKYLESIQKACGLRDISPKEFIKDLFFDPRISTKNCFLSPSSAKIHLDISKVLGTVDSSTSTPSLKIDQLKKGKLKGSLKYGIFDYSTKIKQITTQNGSGKQKYLGLKIDWPLTFYQEPDKQNNCSVKSLLKKVRRRELTFEELKSKCI